MSKEGEISGGQVLGDFEGKVVSFFCDGVKMLGLPRSLGEIYGLLFITPEPLSLDDLVSQLGISKGSVSQGLRMLKNLGAVRDVEGIEGRRTYYEPDVELKQLVGGFIQEQVRPHLHSGESKLQNLEKMVVEMEKAGGEEPVSFYRNRVERLGRWSTRARFVLPVLQKFLGR